MQTVCFRSNSSFLRCWVTCCLLMLLNGMPASLADAEKSIGVMGFLYQCILKKDLPGKVSRVVVIGVSENSPALAAGLKKGDILLGIDGREFQNLTRHEVDESIHGAPGTIGKLSVVRKGSALSISCKRVNFSDIPNPNKGLERALRHHALTGIELAPHPLESDELAYHSIFEAGRKMPRLVIKRILPDSPASFTGLREGDVLKSVNGKSTALRDQTEIEGMLRGSPDSTVFITVQRGQELVTAKCGRYFPLAPK